MKQQLLTMAWVSLNDMLVRSISEAGQEEPLESAVAMAFADYSQSSRSNGSELLTAASQVLTTQPLRG